MNETAIEKWVGLTRRVVAIERKYHCDDPTLIRHVYDLHAIMLTNKFNNDSAVLTKVIIANDAKQFKTQHPEYFTDPESEISQSLEILKNRPMWKKRFQDFIEVMVYEKVFTLTYENAIQSLENVSSFIINSLAEIPGEIVIN